MVTPSNRFYFKSIGAVLLMGAALLAIFLTQSEDEPTRLSQDARRSQSPSGQAKAMSEASEARRGTNGSGPQSSGPGVEASLSERKLFLDWFATEAKLVESTGVRVNSDQLRDRALRLSAWQMSELTKKALSQGAAAGERILAVYLLDLAGPNAQGGLTDMISEPLPSGSSGDAHSEGELRGVQERALRTMAIDALANQAKSDPTAREALRAAVASQRDPTVRRYGEDKLKNL